MPRRGRDTLQGADRHLRPAAFEAGDVALISFDPLGQLCLRQAGGRARAQDRGGYEIPARRPFGRLSLYRLYRTFGGAQAQPGAGNRRGKAETQSRRRSPANQPVAADVRKEKEDSEACACDNPAEAAPESLTAQDCFNLVGLIALPFHALMAVAARRARLQTPWTRPKQ